MVRFLLSIILIASCLMAKAEVTLGFEGEKFSQVGIYVKDLQSGQLVAENNANVALVPASITKSVTAAVALTRFGRNHQFVTPVYLYGQRSETDPGTWHGNLVVESCGDPTIGSPLFKGAPTLIAEIIAGLRSYEIKNISGSIVISEPQPDQGCPPQWEIEDVAWAYGAGWHGFNYQDNTFKLWPATGEMRPRVPGLEITVEQMDCPMTLLRGIGSNHLYVYARDVNAPNWQVTTTMPHPAAVFAAELEERLDAAGISLGNDTSSDASTRLQVCEHHSAPMADMLREMMYESHNLFAEGMLRALAPEGDRDEAIKAYKDVLMSIGVNTRYNTILDGSGLARGDRLRPAFLSNVFEAMAKGDNATSYLATFPIAGVSGTVKSLLKKTSLQGRLALKSGSMNGVQCYAGYMLSPSGQPTHTVVIQVNSFFCPRAQVRAAIEKFLIDTFSKK